MVLTNFATGFKPLLTVPTKEILMQRIIYWVLAILCIVLAGCRPATSPIQATDSSVPTQTEEVPVQPIIIHPQTQYQRIDNFGASGAWSMDPIGSTFPAAQKEQIADLLFSTETGIGLSAFRFNIGAGSIKTDASIVPPENAWRMTECFKADADAEYDWTKQAGQQWFLQAAKDRGVDTLIAFVNSPPVWMTKNGHGQCDETVGSTNLPEGAEADFAAFLCDVLAHFEEQGLAFDYISPINEPEWNWDRASQEGSRYNNADIVRTARALADALDDRALDTQILLSEAGEYQAMMETAYYEQFKGHKGAEYQPESTKYGGDYNQRLSQVIQHPDLLGRIAPIAAVHGYWNDDIDRLERIRVPMAENMRDYPDTRLWMSEYCVLGDWGPGRDVGMDTALWVARVMHYDLRYAQASAWQWWLAVSPYDYKDGLIYTDYDVDGGEMNVIPTKLLWTVGHYARFIRPGAVRIQLDGFDTMHGLMGTAYLSGEDTVVVIINYGTSATMVSLPTDMDTWTPYLTTAVDGVDLQAQHTVEGGGPFTLPARSVVTFVGQ